MIIMKYGVNFLIDKYQAFINTVSYKYNYDDNITHLIKLFLIAFVMKYDIKNEKVIMDCFMNTRIVVSNQKKDNEEAFFYRNLTLSEDYISNKYIIINDFNKENYLDLIDTLIHEFNHAINSMKNEIKIDSECIYLRTGLSYITYKKDDLNNAIGKSDEYILEEVINTKQTIDIINIIKDIDINDIESNEFCNFVTAVKRELAGDTYVSKAYFLESKILETLIKNKTFISTLENLRFIGEINEIELWFDSIVNIEGEYKKLNRTLREIFDLEIVYINRNFFKKTIESKIKQKINTVNVVVERFNNNCIYK